MIKKDIRTLQRPFKGRSLFEFPTDYTVIDIETTGLSPFYDEIIEISALKCRNDKLTGSFSTLVKPKRPISRYIKELTGISDEMVADAPSICDALNGFYNFVGDDMLIGHNVNFDVNFLYDNLLKHNSILLTNSFVDNMRLSRIALPNLVNHKQITVAQYFQIAVEGSHRALRDCEICQACYVKLKEILSCDDKVLAR